MTTLTRRALLRSAGCALAAAPMARVWAQAPQTASPGAIMTTLSAYMAAAAMRPLPDERLVPLLPVRVADVEITLNDGTTLTERVTAVRGTPRNPMTRAEVVAKARDLIDPVLGATQAARLVSAVFALERMADMRALRPLLQRA
jgi:hypothetical protein